MACKECSTGDTVQEAGGGFSFGAIHPAVRGRGHDWSQGMIARFCANRSGIPRRALLTRYHG